MTSLGARILVVVIMTALAAAYLIIPPKPAVLVVRVGMSYEEVVSRSSFAARAHGLKPADWEGFGTIDVTEPAVTIKYAGKYGFELPPTKFAAITFGNSLVESISTSPMLESRPFEETVEILAQLQERFKAAGWVPWERNGSVWFDLSPDGRKALKTRLWRYSESEQWLIVPYHAGIIFRIKCVKTCDGNIDDARFLIDVGIGGAAGEP